MITKKILAAIPIAIVFLTAGCTTQVNHYMDFETRKQLGEYFGYSNGNKPPMNKILVSKKFPKINGAIVNYI